ncbi:MAG: LuxR family transcriptional regulator [Leptolyngbyaceae cyanobacterium CSU_1_3]|nr:LuxR family transcriptional regulator [Leptolyngbyaceae cyanobacterium CSU_1_3]
MTPADFREKLYLLTPKKIQVLRHFLDGKSDEEIVPLIGANNRATVSRHISNTCKIFGFANEEGEHFSYREDLIEVFVQFMPEWVCLQYRQQHSASLQTDLVRVELPGSPISASSPFYVQRDRNEPYLDILEQPGALLRIRAQQKMGKTSLLYRILAQIPKENYRVVRFNLGRDVEQTTLKELSQFLQWFCVTVRDALDLEDTTQNSESLSTKSKASNYFQNHILPSIKVPLILILDNADWLFEYPETAKDFFTLLRGWHENANSPGMEIWENLRIVVAHSTQDYLKFDASPFENVGEVIRLRSLTQPEIQHLAQQYQLDSLGSREILSLMDLVGGHPYLIQQALHSLRKTEFKQLLQLAPTLEGIYKTHLNELSTRLKTQTILHDALKQVVSSEGNVQLTEEQTFKLEGMGIVQLQGNQARLSCELYRQYFQTWF